MTKEQLIQQHKDRIATYKINIKKSICPTNKRVLKQLIIGYEQKINELENGN